MNRIENCFNMRGGFCTDTRPDSCGLVIFGASGDLNHRKLIPALFSLFKKNLLPSNFFILGYSRTSMTDEAFQQKLFDKSVKVYYNIYY